MRESRGFRVSWLITLVLLTAALSIGVGDRLLSHWSAAVERGRIHAAQQELARAHEVSNAFRLVSKIAGPGVVHISVGAGDEGLMVPSTGSGIIFDADGFILTNNHVVEGHTTFSVRLSDERQYDATLVGTDPKTDLAVIKIEASNLIPLKFGDSDKMEVGDWVLAVGAPFGLSRTVTHGIISAKGRSAVVRTPELMYQDFIQTDAAINPGNSGGPLLNLKGEVIGVNTAIATTGDNYNAGIAFTIPSNIAAMVARRLKAGGKVVRGWLGISLKPLNEADREVFGLTTGDGGAIVNTLYKDSPADRAGLTTEDIILAVNDTKITTIQHLQIIIAEVRPDQRVTLRVLRNGERRAVKVRLGTQPDNTASYTDEVTSIRGRDLDTLGVHVRSIRSDERWRARRIYGRDRGVFVLSHIVDDEAGEDELHDSDLIVECNGQRVGSVYQLASLLKAARDGRPAQLKVISEGRERRTIYVNRR